MSGEAELRVPDALRRGARKDEDESIASAVTAIAHMCADLDLDDLSASRVLDVGCGVKFTQAFLNEGVPIGSYTGLDVYREMIDFLIKSVDDQRFEYHAIDVYNARYNPSGTPLSSATRLPVEERAFDVICLFSVFTHLDPDDARAMLEVLRRHIAPGGRLFFTIYLDEATREGHGLLDAFVRQLGPDAAGGVATFRDFDPDRPLFWAVYAEQYARDLIAETGWHVAYLGRPTPEMQHHFVCTAI
jgi:SAM-dependent methyltransferase